MLNVIIFLTIVSCNFGPMLLRVSLPFAELYLYRYMIVIMLIYVLLCKLKQKQTIYDKEKIKIKYKFILFYLIWSIYAIASYFWVEDVGAWFRAVFFVVQGFLTIIVWGEILKKRKSIESIFFSCTIINIFFNIFGWYEYFTSNYIFLGMTERISYSLAKGEVIPRVIFDNENGLAYVLTFLLFTTFYAIIKSKGMKKFFYSGLLISTFILIVLVQSRGAIIAIIVGSIFFLICMDKVTLKHKLLRKMCYYTIAIGVLFLGLQLWLSGEIKIDSSGLGGDFVRFNLIKEGLKFVTSTYGIGVGAGNIEFWMKNYSVLETGNILNIHNWWLELITGYGIFIFLGYLAMFIYLICLNMNIMKNKNNDIEIRWIGLIFASILITFTISSMVASSIIASEWTWMMFGIMIGFVMNYSTIIKKDN